MLEIKNHRKNITFYISHIYLKYTYLLYIVYLYIEKNNIVKY